MIDREFYERRLREELVRCVSEPESKVRALHRRWAKLYQARIDRLDAAELGLAA